MTLLLCLSVAGLSVACGILWRRQTRLDAAQAAALASEHEATAEALVGHVDGIASIASRLTARFDAQAAVLKAHGSELTEHARALDGHGAELIRLRSENLADADLLATLAQRVSLLESQRRAPRPLARVRLEAQERKRGGKR